MLNRDRDRERGLPVALALRDKSTHRNGANSHVISSFVCFREPPPPRLLQSRNPGFFFRMPGKVPHLSTLIFFFPFDELRFVREIFL